MVAGVVRPPALDITNEELADFLDDSYSYFDENGDSENSEYFVFID